MAEIALRDPRTGRIDGYLPAADRDAVATVADRLRSNAEAWARTPPERRCQALAEAAEALAAAREALLAALLADTGRWHESVLELDASIATLRRWAAEAPALLAASGPQPTNVPGISCHPDFVPYPLVGVISPWNFPLLLSLIDAVPALAAGCTVLVKPSEVTPRFVAPLRTALARVPPLAGVIDFVLGAADTGRAVVDAVDLVCFTGSVATGRRVAVQAAERFIPAFLELGGKDPAIVLADADPVRAARAIAWGGFVNAGQSCMSIERVYVEEGAADAFLAALVAQARQLKLAHPDPRDGEIGPIISAAQVAVVRAQLDEALAGGARALTGGALVDLDGGIYCPPTVLVDTHAGMKIISEESFAAILPVAVVEDREEAIEAANASCYGLSAAVFAGSTECALAVARRLQVGAVSINDASLTSLVHTGEKQSFKASGLGGSRMGSASLRRFLRPRALLVNPGFDDPWWFPSGS